MFAVSLAAVIVLGLGIRLTGVDAYGIWFDEAYHLALIAEPSVGAMLDAVLWNPPGDPLYPLLLRGWVAMVGHGDLAIRLPSVLFGALTVPATAWLALELDGRRVVVLVAAAFVAVSPYALEFSQEAAPYALACLTTTLAVAAAWRWRRVGGRGWAALSVVLVALAAHSHYAAVAVLGGMAIIGAWRWAGPRAVPVRRWLVVLGVGLATWSPWAVALVLHWVDVRVPRSSLPSPVTIGSVIGALGQYAAGTAALLGGERLHLAAGLLLAAALLAVGWLAGADERRRGLRVIALVTAALILPPAVAAWISGAWLFVAHFFLLVLPGVAVVLAVGAIEIPQVAGRVVRRLRPGRRLGTGGRVGVTGEGRERWLVAATVGAWLLVGGLGCLRFWSDPPHGADGLREIASEIASVGRPDEPVLVYPAILSPSLAHHVDRPLLGLPDDFDLRDVYGPFVPPPTGAELAAATQAATDDARARGATALWLVWFSGSDPGGAIPRALAARFRLVSERTEAFATLQRWEPR